METPVLPDPQPSASGSRGDIDWSLVFRFFTGWDSNVQLYADTDAPDVPELGGFFGGATILLGASAPLSAALTAGASFRGDVVGFADSMPDSAVPLYGTQSDYSFYAVQPSIYLQYRTLTADGTDVTLRGTYSFRAEAAKTELGLAERSNQFAASAIFDVPGPWVFDLSATRTIDDFNDTYPLDPQSNRDGQFTELGAGARYMIGATHLRSIYARISYQRNDAAGVNWSYSGAAVSAGADWHLHGPFDAKLWGSLSGRNYVGDFSSQGYMRHTQQVATIGGQLLWHLRPTATADITLVHEIVGGDDPLLTSRDTRLAAGVTLRLK
jgi:hypothetical protein